MLTKPNLVKPEINGDIDTWGLKLNANVDKQDVFNADLCVAIETNTQEIARLDSEKIDKADLDTVVKEAVDDYIETDGKPQLDEHVETVNKPELDAYEKTKETELDTYEKTKETELDDFTDTQKTELTDKTSELVIVLEDKTTVLKGDLDAHELLKEEQLDAYTLTKEAELEAKADEEIERIHAEGIDGKLDKGTYTGTAETLKTDIDAVALSLDEKLDITVYEEEKEILNNKTISAGSGLIGGGKISENPIINIESLDEGILVNDDNIKLNIVDDLTTGGVKRPLSAEQGKILKQLIDVIAGGGVVSLMSESEASGEYDYLGTLPAGGASIAVGKQLFNPKLYLDGVRIESNRFTVDLNNGLIVLTEIYSTDYDVVWAVEDMMPYHISFCYPTLDLLLASTGLLDRIIIGDVIKILGENEEDDGGHFLIKCESTAKLNPSDIGNGRYLNEIPNTKIASLQDDISNATAVKFDKGDVQYYFSAREIEDVLEKISPTKKLTIISVSKNDTTDSTILDESNNNNIKNWYKNIKVNKNDTTDDIALNYVEVKYDNNSL